MPVIHGPSKKPLWSEEFSVHAAEDKYVLRRQFTKFLTLTSFGMFAGNAWIWVKSLIDRPRAPVSSLGESVGYESTTPPDWLGRPTGSGGCVQGHDLVRRGLRRHRRRRAWREGTGRVTDPAPEAMP